MRAERVTKKSKKGDEKERKLREKYEKEKEAAVYKLKRERN